MQPHADRARRSFLKTLGSAAALTAAGSSSLLAATLLESENKPVNNVIRWPLPIGSPVLDSLAPAIENSRDVHTSVEKIVEVAGWMAYEDLPMPEFSLPFGVGKDPAMAIDFSMVGDCIDFAFTDFKTHQKFQVDYAGQHWSDSDAMFACIKRAMDAGIPFLDGNYPVSYTHLDVYKRQRNPWNIASHIRRARTSHDPARIHGQEFERRKNDEKVASWIVRSFRNASGSNVKPSRAANHHGSCLLYTSS